LSTYVRALAWWHAAPQPKPGKTGTPLVQRESRMKMALRCGNEVDLPYVDPGLLFLVQQLFDAGPVSAGGNGTIPLTWTDLDAWQRVTGAALPPGQLRLLRRLSGEYLDESNLAVEHDAPPPWVRGLGEDKRWRISGHIKNVLRSG